MPRLDYVVKRTASAIVTVFAAVTINFFLFRVLPGSAVTGIGHVPNATPQLRRSLIKEFGLDQSKWEQYVRYLEQLVQGNLGVSFANQQPVTSNLRSALLNTIPVVLVATIIALLLGVAVGVISAWRRGSFTDHALTTTAVATYAFPTQWIALLLLIAFSGVLPTAGSQNVFTLTEPSTWQQILDYSRHMILPSTTLALTLYGGNAIVVRSAMLETLGEDYILTARAKGMRQRRIVIKHALRGAMLPVITLITLSLGTIVAGAILVEVVFSWPGVGEALYDAVKHRDYPMLQGGFLVLIVSVVFFNFIADLLYVRLDPRLVE
jgi:ABC-type dipeptide/oligopeptide/nickel transport system permease component